MGAQYAIQFGAEPFDRAPARLVQDMRAEFHGNAVQSLKRMAQQQKFRFRVQPGFCTARAYQVEPISTRGCTLSIFI
jgi:hypothetical protein